MRRSQQLPHARIGQRPLEVHVVEFEKLEIGIEEPGHHGVGPDSAANLQRRDDVDADRQALLKRFLGNLDGHAAALAPEMRADERHGQLLGLVLRHRIAERRHQNVGVSHQKLVVQQFQRRAVGVLGQETALGEMRQRNDATTSRPCDARGHVARKPSALGQGELTRQMRFEGDHELGAIERNAVEGVHQVDRHCRFYQRDALELGRDEIQRQKALAKQRMPRRTRRDEAGRIAVVVDRNSKRLAQTSPVRECLTRLPVDTTYWRDQSPQPQRGAEAFGASRRGSRLGHCRISQGEQSLGSERRFAL